MRVLDSTVLISTWSERPLWSEAQSSPRGREHKCETKTRKSTSTWSVPCRLTYRRTYLPIFYEKYYDGVILKIHSLEYLLHDSRSYVRNNESNTTCSRFWHRARDRACCYTHLHEFAKVLKVVLVHWTRSHLLTGYEISVRSSTTYSYRFTDEMTCERQARSPLY